MGENENSTIVRRVGIFSWSMLGLTLLVVVAFFVLVGGRVVLAPLLLAVVILYVLNPLVSWLARRGVPRALGTVFGFVVASSTLVLLIIVIFPDISAQSEGFIEALPSLYDKITTDIEGLFASVGLSNISVIDYDQLIDYVNDPDNRSTIVSLLFDQLGAVTAGIVEFALIFIIGPVVAFYLLIDLPSVQKRLLDVFPENRKREAAHVGSQVNAALGGFLRGQLVVAVIVGVMLSAGYWFIGIDFWLLIGLVGGVLNIVPFLGPWVGGILGVAVAITTADAPTALWAVVVALVVQQIDNHFVTPSILRATVRLHPAVTLLSLILGGTYAGVWGVVIVIPLVASIKIVLGHWWRTRVLNQTWEEASEAMFEDPVTPRMRRTVEMPIVEVLMDDALIGDTPLDDTSDGSSAGEDD